MVHEGEVIVISFTNTFGLTMLPCERNAGMLIEAGLGSMSLILTCTFRSEISECAACEGEVVTV